MQVFKSLKTLSLDVRLLGALRFGVDELSEEIDFDFFNKTLEMLSKQFFIKNCFTKDDLNFLINKKTALNLRNQTDKCAKIWHARIDKINSGHRSKPLMAIIVADWQSIRSFLLTDVWEHLKRWGEIVILTQHQKLARRFRDIGITNDQILPIPVPKKIAFDTLLRYSFYRSGKGLTHKIFTKNLNKSLSKADKNHLSKNLKLWEMSCTFAKRKDYKKLYENFMMIIGAIQPLTRIRSLLKDLSPDILVNTNSIGFVSKPWTRSSALEGIPTASFVTSWDNVSTKSLIDEFADVYMLWSREMLKEFKVCFPYFYKKKKVITGSPQFTPIIEKKNLLNKDVFFEKYRLKKNLPLILYTTGSKTTFPAEPEFIEAMLATWGKKYHNKVQFMVRMHPKDIPGRYEIINKRFPEVPFTLAGENLLMEKEWLPVPDDIKLLVNQINHCDVILNVASTMTLEGFSVDKPTVNIGFDLGKINSLHYPLKDYYNSKHYRNVVTGKSVKVAYNYEDVFRYIFYYLENPEANRRARQKIFIGKCNYPYTASKRIDRCIQELARR